MKIDGYLVIVKRNGEINLDEAKFYTDVRDAGEEAGDQNLHRLPDVDNDAINHRYIVRPATIEIHDLDKEYPEDED